MKYQVSRCDRCNQEARYLVDIPKYNLDLCEICACDMITAVADTMPESERNAWLFGEVKVSGTIAVPRQGGSRPANNYDKRTE